MGGLPYFPLGLRIGRILMSAAILLAVFPAGSGAAKVTPKEYRVKAVFLFHFAQFVDWPERAFTGPDQNLVIGVLGADPFGDYLDQVVRGEKKRDRPIAVKRFARPEEIESCHILFLAGSEDRDLERNLGGMKDKGVLTVG